MPSPSPIALAGLAARSASGSAGAVDLGLLNAVRLRLDVSAVAGSGQQLTVSIETSRDGLGAWRSVGSFAVVTAIGTYELTRGDCDRYVRAVWTIAGTAPSFTFEVFGDALQIYASKRDFLTKGIPAAALSSVTDQDLYESLASASSVAHDYFKNHSIGPYVSWEESLRRAVVHIAQNDVMSFRGFNPEGSDALILKRHDDAHAWLYRISRGNIAVPVVDSTPTITEATMHVVTAESRGWDDDGCSGVGEPKVSGFWDGDC